MRTEPLHIRSAEGPACATKPRRRRRRRYALFVRWISFSRTTAGTPLSCEVPSGPVRPRIVLSSSRIRFIVAVRPDAPFLAVFAERTG